MVAYNTLLKNLTKGIKNRMKNDERFRELFSKYAEYSENSDKLPKVYNDLSNKYKQQINAKIAEGNIELEKQNRPLTDFRVGIEYELSKKRPLKSLTTDELSNIDIQAENLARKNYKYSIDDSNKINYHDNFDSVNDAEDFYKNQLIYELTGRDKNNLFQEQILKKLSRNKLEKYTDETYGQFFDKPNELDVNMLDGSEPYDNYLINLFEQEKELDNLLSTGGFNEPIKHIDPKNYKINYKKSKKSYYDPKDYRKFNNLFDEIDEYDTYDGFTLKDFK